jgi:ferredoxin
MKVWIDGHQCSGVALCEKACPETFTVADDGIAHVIDPDGQIMPDRTAVSFAPTLLEKVLEAAESCPEECIFIEA